MNKTFLIVLAFFNISGCSIHSKSNANERYVYTVTIEEKTYGLTGEEVPKEQIGEQIGQVPVACRVPECAPPPGSIFYKIKGHQYQKYIAVLSNDGEKYYRWTKI
ncbi:hypothetical protein [Paenibacillus sp. MMO-177]|uniref:hypothetical protein n=1 Tax=Paenibacillus sp. MMO-177 TaxID=3081289 RepID=UPI00301645DE